MRENLITEVGESLAENGFEAFCCSNSRACFDIVARRELVLLIKILENIDGFGRRHATEILNIAALLSGSGYLIGERTKEFELDDGVMYERYGVPSSNFETFREIVYEKRMPEMRKFKAMSVMVDGEKLRAGREKLGLSLDELAKKVGVSKETLYRYEHEMSGASEENIRSIEEIVGGEVRRGVNPFEKSKPTGEFDFHGFRAIETRAAPFEVLGEGARSRLMVGGEGDMRTMEKRAKIYSKMGEIVDSYSCFMMSKSKRDSLMGIPVIRKEELAGLDKARELIKLIKERGE
ncbi:MAG: helix-turn-helix domain-containing protein [Candidatus Micrarchaeota archaeon]|nr:helix-turn-helix domain-containing protein [Candidatus Micrarchaeota archaeon]